VTLANNQAAGLRLALPPPDVAKARGSSERLLWGLTCPRGPIRSIRVGNGRGRVVYPVKCLEEYIDSLLPNDQPAEND